MKIICTAFLVLLPILLDGEDLNGKKHFSEVLFEATFFIQGNKGGSGTVLCVGCEEKGIVYFLTARHVLDSMRGDSITVYLRKKLNNGKFISFKHSQAIRINNSPTYIVHSNSKVDVAILKMLNPQDSVFTKQFLPFSTELFATEEDVHKYWIHPGDELFFLGFPLGKGSPNNGIFPILRSGFIASYPIVPFNTTETVYLDAPVFEGNSGGPVYFEYTASSWNNRLINQNGKIIGLITNYKYAETVRKIDSDTTKKKHDLLLGGFVNSELILQLFDSVQCK